MTIEASLMRIAEALEVLNNSRPAPSFESLNVPVAPAVAEAAPVAPKKPRKPVAEKAPATEPAPPAVTIKDVAEGVMRVANTVGREAAISILGQFKAAKISEIKPEHYAAVMRLVYDAESKVARPAVAPEEVDLLA